MSTRLIGGGIFNFTQAGLPKGSTRGGQPHATDPARMRPQGPIDGQTLKNGVMFRVNWQKGRAPSPDRIHKNPSGHHQRLFICQQDPLACPRGRECKRQSGCANNCRNNRIRLHVSGQIAGGLLATQNLCPDVRRQGVTQKPRCCWVNHHSVSRVHGQNLLAHLRDVRPCHQSPRLEFGGLMGNHSEGAPPD